VARGVETAPIYALLSSVYEKGNHIENAIPAMRLAIQRDPQSETYRFSYGMLLISALAPDAAVIRLKEALELFPTSSRLWLALGIAHFKAGRNDEAAKSLNKSIELDSKYAPAFVYLGMTHVETGDYKTALANYEKALTLNPKLGIVDFLISDVMMKQADSDYVTIESHLVKAVKSDPKFAPARLALGKLYLRKSQLTEAATEFEKVIALEPKVAEAYYQLGLTYRRLKRGDEANVQFEKFKNLSETQKEQALKDRKDIINRLATVLF
jgi:tetratricopeptide (TPR) repeat protein